MKTILLVAATFGALVISGCTSKEKEAAPAATTYTCPMHPEVVSDKAGSCPICKMDLVPVKSHSEHAHPNHSSNDNISMSLDQQRLAGISLHKVTASRFEKNIFAQGTLVIPENKENVVSAKFSGRVEKLLVDQTGSYVRKGDVLFYVYSPDLVKAQSDYLISLSLKDNSSIEVARTKLSLMGLSDKQIESISKQTSIETVLPFYSPYSGTITMKKIKNGEYFSEGNMLYEISDLTTLWNIAEIYEDDIPLVKTGKRITVSINSKGMSHHAIVTRVSFIYPTADPAARTLKVRADIPNHNLALKPNTFTLSNIIAENKTGLLVPENAVVFTGKTSFVWVRSNENNFKLTEVKIGIKSNGMYEVLEGLHENELIASSGGFFLDAEKQLRSTPKRSASHAS